LKGIERTPVVKPYFSQPSCENGAFQILELVKNTIDEGDQCVVMVRRNSGSFTYEIGYKDYFYFEEDEFHNYKIFDQAFENMDWI
jgi:hypothetical protein